ncbi:Neutral trehalase, putative [Perkinsus marinus ATCC 50983]|uniref:Trehalase n=1 Tax=Perkinsus marinus (strain ATCC 50983 / TXsc) TaxID=423536 RepID=C5KFT8_PERM5|nr:Neutral trehalase, putative [Perkinsus marinus ATCC 50983]EER16640.1 Neutral trehalase, putative [Perkinsus marinus ATCC 50983]|eukprot:XP_002784844.1 Neutral trehalase, putative [Perkinsus marinus ATCC 50983]
MGPEADKIIRCLVDSKVKSRRADGNPLLFVPEADLNVYKDALKNSAVGVEAFPGVPKSTKDFEEMDSALLALEFGSSYMVPGARFNEMYGWDSYFITLGLVHSSSPPNTELLRIATSMLRNHVYQVENYGKVLNANRSYFLNRAQPPLLSSTLMLLLPYITDDDKLVVLGKILLNLAFPQRQVQRATAAIVKEYDTVWKSTPRYDEITGLSKWEIGVEAFPGVPKSTKDFEEMDSALLALEFGSSYMVPGARFNEMYGWDRYHKGVVDAQVQSDMAVRESGHDTTARLNRYDACDMATVDLNCILYKIERDMAFLKEPSRDWTALAEARKLTILRLMYIPERSAFFDYNTRNGQVDTSFLSVTGLAYPLWCGVVDGDRQLSNEVVNTLMGYLGQPGGVVSDDLKNNEKGFTGQWDWPAGWAPHQMITWMGLMRLGYLTQARDLASRWVRLCLRTFQVYDCLPEKFDVVHCTSRIDVEYGNQCSEKGEYFGWTIASVEMALQSVLTAEDIAQINHDFSNSRGFEKSPAEEDEKHPQATVNSCG